VSFTSSRQDERAYILLLKRPFARQSEKGSGPASSALPILSALTFAGTLLLGGAGESYPLITLGIELSAVIILWHIIVSRGLTRSPFLSVLPWVLLLGILGLLLMQLVPIPPSLWRQLPGRELAWRLLTLSGSAAGWRPISFDPMETIATGLETLPALAMFFSVLHLPERDRLRLVWIAVGVGLISALAGALQKAGGNLSPFILFDTPHSGNSPGLFVNRNHQANFLLLSMLLGAGAARCFGARQPERLGLARLMALGLVSVFAAGVVITTSRTGFLLLLPAMAASLLIIFPMRWSWKAAAAAFLLVAGLAAFGSQSGAVQSTIERFSDLDDERTIYWRDTYRAIEQSWPVGTGIGTFRRVYGTVQSVETVGIQYVNNAHNDYLELALEGGVLAVGLMALVLLFVLLAGIRLWKMLKNGGEAALGAAALAAIIVVLLHSIFDYPLRMHSIMAMFGLLWGLVLTSIAQPVRAPEAAAA
jgi:O-antigen ligase